MGSLLSDIVTQPLSSLVSDHLICKHCCIVDRDHNRMIAGYSCPTCGNTSDAGRLYFPINIQILVDLLQEAYHSDQQFDKRISLHSGCGHHDISVVIYFCTLREILLNKFIAELLNAQNIPDNISNQLLSDNKFYRQKQGKLFFSLTNMKWKDSISILDKGVELNYIELDEFINNIAEIRNSFVHEGNNWSISRDLATNCVNHIWPLIDFYVSLHNMFIHPLHKK